MQLQVPAGIQFLPLFSRIFTMEDRAEEAKDREHAGARRLHGAALACGIFVCLLSYGFYQEKIMTGVWGADKVGGRHISSVFLVMCNRVTSMSIAFFSILAHGESLAPGAPLASYSAIAFSNMLATTCQYEALRYVSFPTQTLAKTAKMIPVMIWGTLLARKVYKVKDYIVAAGVTVGSTLFLLTGEVTANKAKASNRETTLMGVAIMVSYLFFDGFTSTVQERLFKNRDVSTWNQMLYVGLLSALVTGSLSAIGVGDARIPPWDPELYKNVMFLSLSAAVAQIFILIMIKEFGALLFATVMTTRQFFSILLSCLLFMHPLSSGQWMGTLLVFASLYFKTFAAALQSSRHSYQSAQQDEDTCAPTKASEGHHAMRQPDDEESPAKPKARHT